MENLTPELIAKAKAAKSAEELLALAVENGIELTEEEAKICFEQLHTNAAVSDDELENVAGGGAICEFFEDFMRWRNRSKANNCPHCGDKLDTTNNANRTNKPMFDGGITTLPYYSNDQKKIELL